MSKKLSALMLAIIVVGAAHMGEQIVTSIEEFYMIRESLGGWYGLFPAEFADQASVLLITIVFTAMSLVFYALMRGGVAPLIVALVFGVFGLTEAHHWIEAIATRSYDPGLFTSFAYVAAGVLLTAEAAKELMERRSYSRMAKPIPGSR